MLPTTLPRDVDTIDILKDLFLIELYENKIGDIELLSGEQIDIWESYNLHPQNVGFIMAPEYAPPVYKYADIKTVGKDHLLLSNLLEVCGDKLCIDNRTIHSILRSDSSMSQLDLSFCCCTVEEANTMYNSCISVITTFPNFVTFQSQDLSSERIIVIDLGTINIFITFDLLIYKDKLEFLTSRGNHSNRIGWNNNGGMFSTFTGGICTAFNLYIIDTKYLTNFNEDECSTRPTFILPGLDLRLIPEESYDSEDSEVEREVKLRLEFADCTLVYTNELTLEETKIDDEITCTTFQEYKPLLNYKYNNRNICEGYIPITVGLDNYRLYLVKILLQALPYDIQILIINAWLKQEVGLAKERLLYLK